MIKNFTIFGERNSGTNYIKSVLEDNLNVPFTQKYGFKHWYIKNLNPRGQNNNTTDNECVTSIFSKEANETLFIYIIRNPFDWAGSMYKKPYHIKHANMSTFYNFLKSKYIAYENERLHPLWKQSKNGIYFIDRSNNIITLRNEKNNHFNQLGKTVKHFYIIRQENLKNDLATIIKNFKLSKKHKSIRLKNYKKPTGYKINSFERFFIIKYINNEIDNKNYFINKLKR